jgi:hypothetical protein
MQQDREQHEQHDQPDDAPQPFSAVHLHVVDAVRQVVDRSDAGGFDGQ